MGSYFKRPGIEHERFMLNEGSMYKPADYKDATRPRCMMDVPAVKTMGLGSMFFDRC